MTRKTKKLAKKSDYHHGDLKRALMKAASELLEEVGYEDFTLRKCAARAGVSPSAPAHHFKDVAGLLTTLAVEGLESLSAQMRAAYVKSHENKVNPCRIVAGAYLNFARGNPALYRLMFGSKLDTGNNELKTAGQVCFEKMRSAVSEMFSGRDENEIDALAVTIWTSLHGFSMLLLEHRLDFLVRKGKFKNFSSLEEAWLDSHSVSIFEDKKLGE